MELSRVCTEADDDSTDSLDGGFTEPIDSEKATISRSSSVESPELWIKCKLSCVHVFSFASLCFVVLAVNLWTITRMEKARNSLQTD